MARVANTSGLMLVGSYTTPEMAELSELYARGCERALSDAFDFTTLHRSADGAWRVVGSLDKLVDVPALTLEDAKERLRGRAFDFGLPQMFCAPGMTEGRALFAKLGVAMIGNPPEVMAVATDKARTRDVVAAAGVCVPEGRVVGTDETVDPAGFADLLPVVVKPVASDNSDGLALVRDVGELVPAVRAAQAFGDVLVERFIPPGRELRCGVIDWRGSLRALPPEEYPVGAAHPVRTRADKLARDGGELTLVAKSADAAWIADGDDPVVPALQEAAVRAYRALGCRHYGLFDFRVDDAGVPWFLEAGLYCSFSPDSVLAAMTRADGLPLTDFLTGLLPAHAATAA